MNRTTTRAVAALFASAWSAAGCRMEVRVGDNLPDDPDDDLPIFDLDRDGYTEAQGDCDDLDPLRGPGDDPTFVEQCDGVDNDCTGVADETEDGLLVCRRQARFVQRLALDLLLVVDTSPRNDDARDRAAAAAPDLLQHLVGPQLDTHVGVLTTNLQDPDESGQLVRPLASDRDRAWVVGRNDSLAAATSFVRQAIASPATQLGGEEGGRAAVSLARSEATSDVNGGFFRSDTALAVLFVSAEEDPTTTPEVVDFVDTLDAATPSLRIHAVAQPSPFGCDGKESGVEGESYFDLATLTNGLTQSVCESDWSPFFSAIGQTSADQGLGDRFPLDEPARTDGISVELGLPSGLVRVLRADEFALSDAGRTLVLLTDPLPPAGTEIAVTYLRTP